MSSTDKYVSRVLKKIILGLKKEALIKRPIKVIFQALLIESIIIYCL